MDALLSQYLLKPHKYRHFIEHIEKVIRHEKHTLLNGLYHHRTDKLRYQCTMAAKYQCRYHFYALWDSSASGFETVNGHIHPSPEEREMAAVKDQSPNHEPVLVSPTTHCTLPPSLSDSELLSRHNIVMAKYHRFFVTPSTREHIDGVVRHEKGTFLHSGYRHRDDKLRYTCTMAGKFQCRYHFYALLDDATGEYRLFESVKMHSHVP